MQTQIKLISALVMALLIMTISCKKDDPDPVPVTPATKSSAKDITAFSFGGITPTVTTTIDVSAKTIIAKLPAGVDLTKLTPTITVSDKATVSPASGAVQDYSKAVVYTVTAEDGSKQAYMVNISQEAVEIKRITVLNRATLILKADGTVWAAGDNERGLFGTGDNIENAPKGFVQIMTGIKDIASGNDAVHMLYLKTDNTVWAAGWSVYGQTGNGVLDGPSVKTAIKIMSDAQSLVAGPRNSFVIKTDKTLWAFGKNDGTLGDGTKDDRPTPVKITDNVKDVASGYYQTLILKTDNTLWGTGSRLFGSLGMEGSTLVTPIKILDDVFSIASGETFTMIIKTDKTLWATGENHRGQLGNGSGDLVTLYKFAKVADNVEAISLGLAHAFALKTDKTLWATGANGRGQLGDGTTVNKNTFTKVMNDVKYVSTGGGASAIYGSTFIIKTDNTLWATGHNEEGELGDGTNGLGNQRSTFIPIVLK